MRVLVCGGRGYANRARVHAVLFELSPSVVITGGAAGADSIAHNWADGLVETERYPADWATHGRAAGPIRNARMLKEGKPDLVVAFPGGKGTADMIKKAKAAGVPVRVITD